MFGNGVEEICDLFCGAGLDIKLHGYGDRNEFKYRGNVRNNDLQQTMIENIFKPKQVKVRMTDADWILWADSDMVYPPTFFGELGHLLRTKFKDNPKCLHSQRKSTTLDETEALIGKYTYPCIIPDAFAQANALEGGLKANIGAGYCQIANVSNLFFNHSGMYCKKENCDRDWDKKGQKARSDQVFRRMVGHEKIPLPVQVHLQHLRIKPDERDC